MEYRLAKLLLSRCRKHRGSQPGHPDMEVYWVVGSLTVVAVGRPGLVIVHNKHRFTGQDAEGLLQIGRGE